MRIFFLITAILIGQCSDAQWFNNISTFTTQNGLSNNTISCLQKDADGFLWIGTHEGLNRYDGTEFINVLSNTKNNLPSNYITKICFISKNLLAVGTSDGLCLLNTETLVGKAINLPLNKNFPSSGYGIADILYKQNTGELWVCTWHGIFILNNEGTILRKMMGDAADIPKGYFARHLAMDARNDVYFYCQQKSRCYYPDFKNQQLIPVEKRSPELTINNFFENNYSLLGFTMMDHESIFVISKPIPTGHEELLACFNNKTGRNFTDKLPDAPINEKRMSNAFAMNDSVFLINSYFGEPYLYNTNNHELKMASDHPLWFTSWPDGLGATIYMDEKSTWIGTSKGLLQSSLKTNFFKTNNVLINKIAENKALVSYNCGAYHDHKLWVSCMGAGLFSLDTAENKVQVFFDDHTPDEYNKKRISTTVLPVNNSIWLFSLYGATQIDIPTSKLNPIAGINIDSLYNDRASFGMKDSKGNIWATLPDGIAKYDITTNRFINYKRSAGNLPVERAGPKTEDNKGNIWMTRLDTLLKFDASTGSFSTSLIKNQTRPIRNVTSIASDGNDVLYMAVSGSFGMYHISTKSIDLFTKQTGIISTVINEIVSDKDGNAWIATEGGLVFYNKIKKKFSSYTKADGLPDDEVTCINFTDKEMKTLFLGFAKSYCLFEPQYFLMGKDIPKNSITAFEVDGESISMGTGQTFSYQHNSAAFRFTGINYNQGQQNNYACMLEGFDQEWKYTGTERKINYVNLPPGTYTFKVKSANHQGEWNEEAATFTFEITPPFWQQWWFRILLIGAIVFGIYYFIKRREASIQKENKLKLQMSELRMQALRAQMNPHFIFNSLNSIQNYILSNNTIDAAGYLSKFAKLMRRILDQSKHNFLPLGEVMETLKLYVEIEAFRFNNEFSFTFTIQEDDDLLDARIPPMLLQPFVENAILHGLMPKQGDKKLIINCKRVNKNVEIIIDDNGIGRTQHNAKAGHESQGEKLTAGMLESLQQLQNNKASIEIIDKKENEIATGTTIKLILPLN
ncbi:MAG: histidine kinase [Ferruginibacter sp.]